MMESEGKPSGLAAAVCSVMAAVRYVRQTGHNEIHRYRYASDEDLLAALQPAMAEAGLALLPIHVESTTIEHSPDRKGKTQWRTDLVVSYRLMHVSGESIELQAPGCGIDGEDKGAYKAMTGALKYVLRHTFLVPTGDDAERARQAQRDPRQQQELPLGPEAKSQGSQGQAVQVPPPPEPGISYEGWRAALSDAGVDAEVAAWWCETQIRDTCHPRDMTEVQRAKAAEFFCSKRGRTALATSLQTQDELRRSFWPRWRAMFPEASSSRDGTSKEEADAINEASEAHRRRLIRAWWGVDSLRNVSSREALNGVRSIGWLRACPQAEFEAVVNDVLGRARAA